MRQSLILSLGVSVLLAGPSVVRAQLPVEQHPKYYKIVSEFPMTGSGKVQKFKLAHLAKKEYVH